MTLGAFLLLLLALPTLLLGERVLFLVRPLSRLNIPSPIVGGLVVASMVLLIQKVGKVELNLQTQTTAPWWTFWVTTHAEWRSGASKSVILPLLVIFYTTLGLGASWKLLKAGGVCLLLFLLSTLLASAMQNGTGVGVAKLMGESSALGLACGSVSLMGGFSTAIGFAPQFEAMGLAQAASVGTAAATFGLVMSNVVSAPLGTMLIRRKRLAASHRESSDDHEIKESPQPRFIDDVREMSWRSWRFWGALLLLLACAKASAYVSYWITAAGVTLPLQVGAMIVGLAVRSVIDLMRGPTIDLDELNRIGGVALALFLAVATLSLDLAQLGQVALPMLLILTAQVAVIVAYGLWINFRMLGRDYESAVMTTGLLGFALGATPNAIASMKSLTAAFGPAPKAFLIVPVTGAFLSDVINVLIITAFINFLQ